MKRLFVLLFLVCAVGLPVLLFLRFEQEAFASDASAPQETDMLKSPALRSYMDLRSLSGADSLVARGTTNCSCALISPLSVWNVQVPIFPTKESNAIPAVLGRYGLREGKLNRFRLRVFTRDKIFQTSAFDARNRNLLDTVLA